MNNYIDNRLLSSFACLSSNSRGRIHIDEPLILGRSEFQRDRDRIIHSEAFRRLKDKTQVFIYHDGDHYRTRLTHTIEVAQIARSIAKALNVNEDLAETIALAHDLGHPPLGHRGEEVLKKIMFDLGGFNHNEQTIRIVTFLEKKYHNFEGLNLTFETLEGLAKHNGPYLDNKKILSSILEVNKNFPLELNKFPSVEGQVANISDDIAYLTHDFDDGLREKLFTINELREIGIVDEIIMKIKKRFPDIEVAILIHQFIRHLISYFINDIVSTSQLIINENNFKSVDEIRNFGSDVIKLSPIGCENMEEIRKFLFKNMYHNKSILDKLTKASLMIEKLFYLYSTDINLLPKQWRCLRGVSLSKLSKVHKARVIVDYISGMTDVFLKREYLKFYKEEK
ncbi:deoxyguanosinetriphosphate triphosphohydrolase [Alphaproteobacteria bacterium]|nr:deoxyguanosinetriphosphate triphosphohydrolase [Alphaproteobacteria bacterium]